MDLGSSLGAIRKYTLLLPKFDQKAGIMDLEYKIIYRIGNDIPINPQWIGDQIQAAVGKLQAEIDKKNLPGQHRLEFYYPDGHGRVGPKLQASSLKKDTI